MNYEIIKALLALVWLDFICYFISKCKLYRFHKRQDSLCRTQAVGAPRQRRSGCMARDRQLSFRVRCVCLAKVNALLVCRN